MLFKYIHWHWIVSTEKEWLTNFTAYIRYIPLTETEYYVLKPHFLFIAYRNITKFCRKICFGIVPPGTFTVSIFQLKLAKNGLQDISFLVLKPIYRRRKTVARPISTVAISNYQLRDQEFLMWWYFNIPKAESLKHTTNHEQNKNSCPLNFKHPCYYRKFNFKVRTKQCCGIANWS